MAARIHLRTGQRLSARILVSLCAVVAALSCASCDGDVEPEHRVGQPPTVWLESGPPEGSETSYRVALSWGGSDPDGSIAYYEFAVTDNDDGAFDPADTTGGPGFDPWHRIDDTDSLFTFSADRLEDSTTTSLVSRFERSHTFFIRAVDNEGLASTEPAYRSFTAWTLSPSATILVPRRPASSLTPATVQPVTTYHWRAIDFVTSTMETQEPDSIRWILHPAPTGFQDGEAYIRTHPRSGEWSAWHDYRAPGDAGRQWTTPPQPLGAYVFAIQAKDEAGAVTPVFDPNYNIRRVRVSIVDAMPLLEVWSDFMCPITSTSLQLPPVIVDVPAGYPLSWTWRADASYYGGIIAGYRYGWDIVDLDDPAQWEVDFTPFVGAVAASPPRTFYFGSHTFDVEVIDNNGWRSRIEVKINVIPLTMGRGVLFVDDFNPASAGIGPSNGAVPSDAEHDQFWRDMLSDVPGFSWETDAVQVDRAHPLSLVRLQDYRAVIWDAWGGYNTADAQRPLLYDVIRYRESKAGACVSGGKAWTDILSLYMRAGGHVMVCGYQPMTQVIPGTPRARYPFIFKFDLGGHQTGSFYHTDGETSFAYRDACLDVLDLAYTGLSYLRDEDENGCGVDGFRTVDPAGDGMRDALPFDALFPPLTLRPEVAGPGKVYAPSVKGWNAEIYDPGYFDSCPAAGTRVGRVCFEPIYGNGCLNTASPIYHAPVAFWCRTYADIEPVYGGGPAARSVFLGFEPYYFVPLQVKELVDIVVFAEWGLASDP